MINEICIIFKTTYNYGKNAQNRGCLLFDDLQVIKLLNYEVINFIPGGLNNSQHQHNLSLTITI